MYLLDTDTCSYIFTERSKRAQQRFERCRAEDLAISAVTLCELKFGVELRGSAELALQLDEFLETVRVEPFSALAAGRFAQLKTALTRVGKLIDPYDMQIAAHAISLGAILVTHNTREFSRIAGLDFEDWVTDFT